MNTLLFIVLYALKNNCFVSTIYFANSLLKKADMTTNGSYPPFVLGKSRYDQVKHASQYYIALGIDACKRDFVSVNVWRTAETLPGRSGPKDLVYH